MDKSYYNSAGSHSVSHAGLLPGVDSTDTFSLLVLDRGLELQIPTKVS